MYTNLEITSRRKYNLQKIELKKKECKSCGSGKRCTYEILTRLYRLCMSYVCTLYRDSHITNNKPVHYEKISIFKKQRNQLNSCFNWLSSVISFEPNVRLRYRQDHLIRESNSFVPIYRMSMNVYRRDKIPF